MTPGSPKLIGLVCFVAIVGTEVCCLIGSWQPFGNAVCRLAHRRTFL